MAEKAKLVLLGQPNERQKEFFLAHNRHICYGGARGGGKTWALRRKFVLLAIKYAGLRLLLLRRTLPELRENHIRPLLAELSGFASYNETEKVFKFPNGSIMKMGYCDSENDVYQYQGQEYEVVGLEEATQFTETQMQFLTTCNRTTRTDFTPRMYYTCNPGGVGHQWVKRLFIDKEYRQGERPESYTFIPARVYDNKILLESNPEYLAVLEALPEDLRRAYLDGDWDVLAGQFFKEWRRGKHVIDPIPIPADWRRFRAIDWGYNDPCCCLWFAVGDDAHIYVYDEYYGRERLAVDVAQTIRDKTGLTKIAYTAASPDMWQRRGTQIKTRDGFYGESIAEAFAKSRVPLTRADNSRIVGWQRVREYLRDAPDGRPYLQVFSGCENLIKYMPQMIYDENDREDVADGLQDHAPEALRYGLMSRPSAYRPKRNPGKVLPFDPLSEPKRQAAGGFFTV